jgi:hypothetical protein
MKCEYCGNVANKIIRKLYCSNCYKKLLNVGKIEKLKKLNLSDRFTSEQKSIFVGSMLGDGNLDCYKDNARYRVSRKLTDKEYLIWNANKFSNFIPKLGEREQFDERTKNTYHSIYFQTRFVAIFGKEYKKWYNGKKIIPKDLTLDFLSIAIWFCDDGNLFENCLTFSTDGFQINDVIYLKEKLNEIIPIFNIYRHKENFTIRTYKGKDMLELIKEYIPISMNRKINNVVFSQ